MNPVSIDLVSASLKAIPIEPIRAWQILMPVAELTGWNLSSAQPYLRRRVECLRQGTDYRGPLLVHAGRKRKSPQTRAWPAPPVAGPAVIGRSAGRREFCDRLGPSPLRPLFD